MGGLTSSHRPEHLNLEKSDESLAGPRINQYENGVHQPRQEMLVGLARVLNVPAAYLLTSDELLARVLLAWPRLSEAERLLPEAERLRVLVLKESPLGFLGSAKITKRLRDISSLCSACPNAWRPC